MVNLVSYFENFDIIINIIRNKQQKAMKFFQNMKEAIKMGDFFNSFQMLRYQQQTEYRTFTGGLISMGIVITIVVAFASMILNTINRTTINYTSTSNRQTDPQLSALNASSKNNFMFGVQVWGYNLSSENRYFDVVFQQIQSNYGQNYTHTSYPLQPCTIQHWQMLPTVVDQFDSLKVGNWLCPPIDTIIELQGKYSSQYYKQFSVTLYPCNNNTDPLRPCAPRQEIDQYIKSNGLWNYFTYYYVNSIINPQEPEYIEYYLEDRQWIIFGSEMGAELDMYLTEIDITSDNSILPYTDHKMDIVYYIDLNSKYLPLLRTNDSLYATFFVMKDPILKTYNRQVQKIFVVFSFMGGLIGAVMAGLFIVTSYTSFSYEIALAREIFKDKKGTSTQKTLRNQSKGSINIFQYAKYYLFKVAQFLKVQKIQEKWPFINYIDQCRNQILNQLDIKSLIKRIIFLQYAISYMLEDFHLAEMQNEMTYHLSQVKGLRAKFTSDHDSQGSDNSGGETNKELEDISSALERVSTNQHIIHSRRRNPNAVVPMQPVHEDNINIENIVGNSEPRFDSSKDDHIKKRQVNFKKLTLSAKDGNIVSKKLLDVIIKNGRMESFRDIESTRFTLRPIVRN